AEKSPNSLVLRYACKAFSKPLAYNQVLFHKTCQLVLFRLRQFFSVLIDYLQDSYITGGKGT
ncbi:MAG: hypothetical protein UH788_08970, partial [Treponemataceae bacterium]|nr:hypothetical protein [Treponemataceae bacterium]